MRTFSPCWNALTVCTGVAKSTTSSRRRRFSGSEVLRNSMTMFWPCWRISMPVVVSVRSIMMRPSPALPRRKSTSRIACLASALPSAKCATWPAAAGGRRRSRTQRNDDVLAVERDLMRHRAAQVEHQARAVRALHQVHAAQLALATSCALRPSAVGGVREIEHDARRIGDREAGRHGLERLLGGDPHHDVAALLGDVEGLDAVAPGRAQARSRAAIAASSAPRFFRIV